MATNKTNNLEARNYQLSLSFTGRNISINHSGSLSESITSNLGYYQPQGELPIYLVIKSSQNTRVKTRQ
ncbi:hypothetical protein [Nostoc sp. PCC 7107]|uniref:hypothetical protein n=1 Tax=Nostoc sp. PCC 7107 TaxID=317936 RepID=UPI0012FA14CE|nr:hypothetical protein [Nostoc sp. PCC 7107]